MTSVFTFLDSVDWMAALREVMRAATDEEWDFYYGWLWDIGKCGTSTYVYEVEVHVPSEG